MMATRRDMLTGATAAAAGAFLPLGPIPPAAAADAADTTLLALEKHRKVLVSELNGPGPHDNDEATFDALGDRISAVEAEILGQPAGTLAGALVKLRIIVQLAEPNGYLVDRFILSLADDLERLVAST